MAVDGADNVIIGGNFQSTSLAVSGGTAMIRTAAGSNAFVAKLSGTNGANILSVPATGGNSGTVRNININSTTPINNIVVSGNFNSNNFNFNSKCRRLWQLLTNTIMTSQQRPPHAV